ncbi:hypothetical protein [Edaphocola flava]|uniref:hypothetical protein n=1 Tax=Edaphocola flava TaxID=2499629 RepID=UPI00100A63E7|nr:hypothetical protein [Edaphocola flava]
MNKNKTRIFSPIMIVVLVAVTLLILFSDTIFSSRSEFDVVDKPNDKMIAMFNTEIDKEIDNHTQSASYPGYIPESRQNVVRYLKTLRSIEGYARYGVQSTKPHNYIELKLTFTDGSSKKEVYTGYSVSGFMGPSILMKVDMENGRAVKVYTNGQEKKGSPEWVIPEINMLINKAIAYDINQHHNHYFAPEKTQKDFEKEWEKQ